MLTILLVVFGVFAADSTPTKIWLSQTARAQLVSLPGDFRSENLACMVGSVNNATAKVDSLVEVPLDATEHGTNWISKPNACRSVAGTIGIVHSHPDTMRCWYMFPRTNVPTSDARAARSSPFAIDAISCAGKTLVWVNKEGLQQIVEL